MFNQNSPIIQNMINTGQFGSQIPLQQTEYSPYEMQPQFNNMMPISQVGYNQQYNQQQLPQQNDYVFAPVQPQYVNYAQPQYNYYDPYGMKGYNNQYQQPQYGNGYYTNSSPIQYEAVQKQQQNLMKLKYKIAGGCFGIEYNDNQLEAFVNPQVQIQQMSKDERELIQEKNLMDFYTSLVFQPPLETQAMRTAMYINQIQKNFHEEFDSHGLRQFLDEDLWKLQREFWIRENVKSRGRDLSVTYSSEDYNELLSMHRSSNPYVNELLDTSRYDNNIDDMEIGLPAMMDMRRRRKQILEGKVPTFISSEETQQRRHEFTSQILNQIYNKGGNNSV